MVAAAIAELGLEPAARVTRVGVTELPECGTNDEVLAYHGLDVAGLVARSRSALRRGRTAGARRSHDRSVLGYRRHAADDGQGRRAGVGAAVREVTGRDFQLVVDPRRRADRLSDRGADVRDARRRRRRRDCCAHGAPLRGAAADDAAARSRAACCRTCARFSSTCAAAADVRSYLLTGNTRGGAQGEADALRPVALLSRRRVRRGRRRARDDRRARARAGAARRSGRRRLACSSSATRRTTSTAPTPSAPGRSPSATGGYTLEELADAPAVARVRRAPPPSTSSCS